MEKVSKNFIWMSAANITNSVLSAILFMYLARALNVEAFGYLSYASAFAFYILNFVDLGLSTYGVREIARNGGRVSELVSDIVSFKFLVACALYVVSILIALLLWQQPAMVRLLIAGSCLLIFTTAFATEWAFQGMERMHMVFISFTVSAVLQLGFIYALVKGPHDILKVPVIYFLATVPILVIFLRRLHFRLNIRHLDTAKMRLYLSSSLIIWLISICVQTYNNLDVVILGFFRTADEVGYFAVARRIVGGITALTVFLANAALPRLAHTFQDDISQFRSVTKKFLHLSVILIVAALIPLIFFSRQLISITVGGQYLPARLPLDIMLAGVIMVLLNMPFSTGLIATGHEKAVLKQAAASALLSIVSNFIFIPKYGMIGASVSFLLVEMFALAWIIWVYQRTIGLRFIAS